MMRPSRAFSAFLTDAKGFSAAEFALILPVMVALFMGGFALSQVIAANRKVTTTTRAIADLTTRAPAVGLSTTAMSNILNASAQVMAPFPTSTLTIVDTQFKCIAAGIATVVWSVSLPSGKALTAGSSATLPLNICLVGGYVVRADVYYAYTPALGSALIGTINLNDSLYMSPRSVQSITYPAT